MCNVNVNVKSFPSHQAHRAALISVYLALSQFTLPVHGDGTSASPDVPVYSPAFAGTHCAYPRSDGQAELTWLVTHESGGLPGQPSKY